MSSLVVPCPHCNHSSRLDASKLPDRAVHFACPHCKERVVVDRRQHAAPVAAATEPVAEPAKSADPALPEVEATIPDRRFSEVPSGAVFPSGIILGEDESVVAGIQETLAALGSELEQVESVDAARNMIVSEEPELCIFVAGKVETVPHAPMAPLTRLHPSIRRRMYLTLVADNLKTFDGNAAFMHQVNLVVSRPDLPQLASALHAGLEHHKRLYRAYLEACEKKGSI